MVLGWLLLLAMALPLGTTDVKNCMFCELTDSSSCPGILMNCGDDEECFVGQGTAPGLSPVISKGCKESRACGHEEPVNYQGVTYSLISTCCFGHMCNGAATLAGTGLVLSVLLLPWL